MQSLKKIIPVALPVLILLAACNNGTPATETPASTDSAVKEPKWKEENITYNGDNATLDGYVVYDENSDKKRPAILVVPEWWGLNDYPKFRARELAKLGYVAFAIDIYGNGKLADNPDSASKYSGAFYTDPQKAKTRIDAAITKIK